MRGTINLFLTKLAQALGPKQTAIDRYDNNLSDTPYETLLHYADFFDVSLDYIFGRTDDSHGRTYQNQPKVEQGYPEMQFNEMCFDPQSPMNARLKATLKHMLVNGEKRGRTCTKVSSKNLAL